MKRISLKLSLLIVLALGAFFGTIRKIERTPYHELRFYSKAISNLDSIERNFDWSYREDSLMSGYSKISITPPGIVPLAGYGARDPKEYDRIHDSAFVRTLVFRSGVKKQALISADLLVIHPELRKRVEERLGPTWKNEELFFTATHTHSGYGGWVPGAVGELFAGDFDEHHLEFIAGQITQSVQNAQGLASANLSYGELSVDDHVKNRLTGEGGDVDPWFKILTIETPEWRGLFTTYSAHATCFGADSRLFSGDYPAQLCKQLEMQSDFAAFAAGAVASMGPKTQSTSDSLQVVELATDLSEQVILLTHMGMGEMPQAPVRNFRLPIELREPAFKISKNLALRPWLFRMFVQEYPVYLSVFQVGNLVFIGFPCDFSGELAVPLYEAARNMGLNLIITSFNGGYMGYVPKDNWYDLDKYETRTMSWYGPDTGAYFSEMAMRILTMIHTHD